MKGFDWALYNKWEFEEERHMNETREWASGAYRDTNDEKLDYEAFYSPLVVREFARYMHKHRKQSNGKLREGDNWQGLFGTPKEHRKVCMKSLWRHFQDLWMLHRGYRVGGVTKKEVLCAMLFNVQAYLFSILVEEEMGVPLPSDLSESDRDGLPCDVCGGDSTTGHQRLCSTLYTGEEETE